ncbi:MAG TPA: VOC family protein [Xanthobacteraceae bacterium]|nr:VOC family protein [Xanthobacteraceae bacterium]
MIQVRRLGHASFSTPDLEGQVAYYADVLGLRVLERDRDRAYLATRTGLEAIVLERGDAVALRRLSFQVAPGSDLAALARELAALGIKSERRSGISPGIAEALVFRDIKGTSIELFADYNFAGDDGVQAVITPLKLGHVAYRVTDVQEVTRFYTEVLGFRVSDWRDTTFAFLRCNTDHHTVNFVVDPVPQLHHIAFEVKDWPEIHRACDFLARNGIRLVWGPARHIIGHNIAAYHRNADNVRVELFCEMDQMKDEALGYFDPRPWHQDRPQRPKVWDRDTLRNYWGFGSHGTFRGYP